MMYLSPPAMTRRKKHRGFNLIEAAIVLGVVGLVIGGIWVAAAAVSERQKLTALRSSTITMVENMRSLWRNQSFPNLDWTDVTTNMVSAGVVPANYVSGSTAQTPYGRLYVFVASAASFGPGTPEILLQFAGLPVSACIEISLWINSNYVTYDIQRIRPSNSSSIIALPTNISTIRSACNAAVATADVYSIVFGK